MSSPILLDNDGQPAHHPAEIPYGLDAAIHNILTRYHMGKENAISGEQLLANLSTMGFRLNDERDMRECIGQMRLKGELICATGGINGGYWYAKNSMEVYEFTQREYRAKSIDMLEKAQVMEKKANQLWGPFIPENQISMF